MDDENDEIDSEYKILTTLQKSKYSIVNRNCLYSSWFKEKMVNNPTIRKQFENTNWNKDEFRENIRKNFARRNLPKSIFKNTKESSVFYTEGFDIYSQILHKNAQVQVIQSTFGGIGLKLKSEKTVRVNQIKISGSLHVVNNSAWQKLYKRNYPSLLRLGPKNKGVFSGPLSYVNHDCSSPYRFKNLNGVQKKRRKKNSRPAPKKNSSKKRRRISIKLVSTSQRPKKYQILCSKNELSVYYGSGVTKEHWFNQGQPCKCITCDQSQNDI